MAKVICPEPGSQLTVGSITFAPVLQSVTPEQVGGAWRELHAQREDLKEAVRLLRLALGAFIDRGQIEQFLKRHDDIHREGKT